MSISNIKVKVTPLKTELEYGDEIDITDYVLANTIGSVDEKIDSGNYDIGLYTYADLTITLANYDGRFNDDTYSSSIFYYTRDRALIVVEFYDTNNTTVALFKGLVNDEATTQDFNKDIVKLKVLSRDSILRKTNVPGGLINNGSTISSAISKILNRSNITNVLNYDNNLITVGIDSIIDDASVFSDTDTRSTLEKLLNASGSVFRINNNDTMVVSSRDPNIKPNLELFGGGNLLQENNIVNIDKFNDGLQRTFNSFVVNENVVKDDNFINRYGSNIKTYDFKFITSTNTSSVIAEYLLNQFKDPKNELEVTIPIDLSNNLEMLDPVVISFIKKTIGYNGNRVPIAGIAIAGKDLVPYSSNGIIIFSSKKWKIIGIKKDTKNFLATLRLREI